ncbi:bifunctional diaminohydroxyphosphoribosylaminopyrimidine deaminase/5-amino-6-(5-phosphoribosylamino)uracil reductase RibD [Castellaniella sp.]|uniref:bifunctional diaminohydroxyphosphoribosylaminopyrimidine deaminase/5-amino-6-(5-phosphoribosylamino)uracil reductase RibD n=1 Tax=Castellaniella sp. TaxID=1955812 RepID=UPI003568FE6B
MTAPIDSAVFSTHDQRWMRRALKVAEQACTLSNPNPRVGCVLVRDGHWLAEGSTQKVGGRHAEAQALHEAERQEISVAGATAYVTLEPCSHRGRTPPCTEALIRAGIRRVVVGLRDPNPQVAGRGLAVLRAAGLQVEAGLFAEDTLAQNPGFCARMVRGTPWVRVKTAASLDGRTALPDGRSQWITGEAARADGHAWRARACVVLTGLGTVLADDPRLDVRDVPAQRQPVRAVLDSHLAISEHARLIDGRPVWIFSAQADPEKIARLAGRQARVVRMPADGGGLDLGAVLRWLGAHEVNEVHVEAGARLTGALVAGGYVDEWVAYVAPSVLGAGRGLVALTQPVTRLEEAPAYEFLGAAALGRDMRLHLRHAGHWQALRRACRV